MTADLNKTCQKAMDALNAQRIDLRFLGVRRIGLTWAAFAYMHPHDARQHVPEGAATSAELLEQIAEKPIARSEGGTAEEAVLGLMATRGGKR